MRYEHNIRDNKSQRWVTIPKPCTQTQTNLLGDMTAHDVRTHQNTYFKHRINSTLTSVRTWNHVTRSLVLRLTCGWNIFPIYVCAAGIRLLFSSEKLTKNDVRPAPCHVDCRMTINTFHENLFASRENATFARVRLCARKYNSTRAHDSFAFINTRRFRISYVFARAHAIVFREIFGARRNAEENV